MSMVFKWKDGYHGAVSANIAGEVCKRLETEGRLTAKDLLEESRPDDAPLHKAFEWRDDVAAEKYREHQARMVINHLVTVREEAPAVRSFLKISSEAETYQSVEIILSTSDGRDRLLESALRELESFERKYRDLTELANVIKAIDDLMEEAG